MIERSLETLGVYVSLDARQGGCGGWGFSPFSTFRDRSKFTGYIGWVLGEIFLKKVLVKILLGTRAGTIDRGRTLFL